MHSPRIVFRRFFDHLWSPRVLPWLAASLGLVAAYWGWHFAAREEKARELARFERIADDTKQAINSRIESCKALLHGTGSLFAASTPIGRAEWVEHARTLQLEKNYPGVRSLSYVALVSRDELASHISTAQAEVGSRYIIHPSGDRDEYRILQMIAPLAENASALGMDVNTRTVCKDAMDHARDSGEITMTGRYRLAQDPGERAAVVMYLPIYRKGMPTDTVSQRRAAITGWANVAIDIEDLLQGLLSLLGSHIQLELYDGATRIVNHKLFDNADYLADLPNPQVPHRGNGPIFTKVGSMQHGGRPWTLAFTSTPSFASSSATPELVAVGGFLMSLLIFKIVSSSTTMRLRAMRLAAVMTESLRQNQAHMRILSLVVDSTDSSVIITDRHGHIDWINNGFTRMTGYSREEVAEKRLTAVLSGHDTDPEVMQLVHERLDAGQQFHVELVFYTKAGKRFWATVEVQPVIDNDGQVTNFLGVMFDVTERKAAEELFREKEKSLRRYHEALSSLARHEGLFDGEHRRALQIICEKASDALDVERISIWLFDGARRSLFCQNLFGRSTFEHSQGSMLRSTDFPSYFAAMSNNELIAADDAYTDPRTCEFAETYLGPMNIASMLDVPIRSNGRLAGVLCHEHIGTPRNWTLEEQNFACAMSSLISLVMESSTRRGVERTLEHQAETLKLQNVQLEEARAEALRSSEAVSSFLSRLSVELRTSTATILVAAERLAESVPESAPALQEDVDTIQQSATQVLSIVQQIAHSSETASNAAAQCKSSLASRSGSIENQPALEEVCV